MRFARQHSAHAAHSKPQCVREVALLLLRALQTARLPERVAAELSRLAVRRMVLEKAPSARLVFEMPSAVLGSFLRNALRFGKGLDSDDCFSVKDAWLDNEAATAQGYVGFYVMMFN